MPADQLEGVALVTGGGRGIGASIARELTDAGMKVAVTGRTAEQVNARRLRDRGARADRRRRECGRRRALGRDDRTGARADRAPRRQCRDGGPRLGDLGHSRWTIGGACRRSTCSACISPLAPSSRSCSIAVEAASSSRGAAPRTCRERNPRPTQPARPPSAATARRLPTSWPAASLSSTSARVSSRTEMTATIRRRSPVDAA